MTDREKMQSELSMSEAVVVESELLVDKPKRFVREVVRMPDGLTIDWYYVDTPSSVVVLPVTEDGMLVFVRQYRHNLKKFTVELPAGAVNDSESFEHAALRELREETGYVTTAASSIEILGSFYALPSETNRYVTFVLVKDVCRVEQSLPSGDGQIERYFDMRPHLLSPSDALANIGKDILGVETAMVLMLAKAALRSAPDPPPAGP
ncbi:MAG TPA: NUDIX hydrolase [Pseudonocardiaceae bacterium]|nr:NUDIX hydrolase [Pseudonocardiaceae bacterium]